MERFARACFQQVYSPPACFLKVCSPTSERRPMQWFGVILFAVHVVRALDVALDLNCAEANLQSGRVLRIRPYEVFLSMCARAWSSRFPQRFLRNRVWTFRFRFAGPKVS